MPSAFVSRLGLFCRFHRKSSRVPCQMYSCLARSPRGRRCFLWFLMHQTSSWNAALILAARAICTPLAAGCTVVLKASELSPKSHHLLVQALFDAGLEKDAINFVQVDREDAPAVTEALISHKAIRKVEFIGSAAVGKIIGSLAGKYLKPVLMELGGKCAVIVLEDADLDDAAMKCVFAGS